MVSEGVLSDYLRGVLDLNLPKTSKKKKIIVGVSDKNLAGSIKAEFTGVDCETGDTSEVVADLLRGIRRKYLPLTILAAKPPQIKLS